MKTSELIAMHFDEIVETMKTRNRIVLGCYGRIQYKLYIWDDGEIETLETVNGDNSWLQPNSGESRNLHYITTIGIGGGYFDPWDVADHARPEDEKQREQEEQELIDWCCDQYDETAEETLWSIYEDAVDDEEYGAHYPPWETRRRPAWEPPC